MEFSPAGSHMVMQGYEPSSAGELYGFQQPPAVNPNPNPDHWPHVVDGGGYANMRPTQGLSLSLSNQEQNLFMDDGGAARLLYQPSSSSSSQHQQHHQQVFLLRRSKYLIPAQELLNEFCNLGTATAGSKKNENKGTWDHGGPSSLYSMDIVELQKRKAKLLSMLEEVHRRYKRYCEQMRAVVSSFEAMAGEGSATVYSALASKAMSRHFRCLKDGIMSQIQATKAAMGERDTVAPGTTKGETPRLKKLEQCLRQQRAFQQAGIMESQPWRPQRGLPERSVSVLRAWLFEHFLHPYPSDVDKHILARQTGLSRSQVSNWFINARVRLWKPMVEEMYMEELKEEERSNPNPNASSSQYNGVEEQKPVPDLLLANDTDSLSSIVNHHHHHGENISNRGANPDPNFGVVDLDFSSYNGGGVSLTLGLQQQERSAMNLSFSPASQQPLLYSSQENNMDDHRPMVQFSMLDEEGQNLPYRNLMGAQMLHDLAG